MSKSLWPIAGLVAAAFAASEASAQVAKLGDVMKHEFTEPLVNGQGIKSLADLAGRPVVVEFWGTA